MELNGHSLLASPLQERLESLRAAFTVTPNVVGHAEHRRFDPDPGLLKSYCRYGNHGVDDGEHDLPGLREFLKLSFQARCEGLMIKTLGPRLVAAAEPATPEPSTKTKKRKRKKASATADAAKDTAKDMVAPLFTYQPDLRCDNWLKVGQRQAFFLTMCR